MTGPTTAGPFLSAAARLAADAHRLLIASLLHLEAAGAVSPEAEADIAELLEDAEAYADELFRVADDFGRAAVRHRLQHHLGGMEVAA